MQKISVFYLHLILVQTDGVISLHFHSDTKNSSDHAYSLSEGLAFLVIVLVRTSWKKIGYCSLFCIIYYFVKKVPHPDRFSKSKTKKTRNSRTFRKTVLGNIVTKYYTKYHWNHKRLERIMLKVELWKLCRKLELYTKNCIIWGKSNSSGLFFVRTCVKAPLGAPSSKVAKLGIWSKKMHKVLKPMKKNNFLVFEIWSISYSKYLESWP